VKLKELSTLLKKKLLKIEDESLVLKGDKNIEYGKIVKIMEIVKNSGIKKLIIGTRPELSQK
jgi:biopolymer transport protein ExbD